MWLLGFIKEILELLFLNWLCDVGITIASWGDSLERKKRKNKKNR